jgi:hypothetical protein
MRASLDRAVFILKQEHQRHLYMGEYQDIWEWYGTWYGSTTYIAPNGNQDIYITRTAP